MSTGRWVLFGIAGAIVIFSIIRTAQGAEYIWATGLAMIFVMFGLLVSSRKDIQKKAGSARTLRAGTSRKTVR